MAGRLDARLDEFLATHPTAVLPKFRGGMTFDEIAAALDTHPASIGQAWRRLQLPPRAQFKRSPREKHHHDYVRRREQHLEDVRVWKERNPERARAIRVRASARWLARGLREENCIVCGTVFAWTNGHEQRRKRRGQGVVCSVRCGMVARRRSAKGGD